MLTIHHTMGAANSQGSAVGGGATPRAKNNFRGLNLGGKF